MIGTRRITGGGSNSAISFANQILRCQIFVAPKSPGLARKFVCIFGERFRQAIRQRFQHDRVIIIVGGFEFCRDFVRANARGYSEASDVVLSRWSMTGVLLSFRRDVVGQAKIELSTRFPHLLSQEMQTREPG